MAARAACCSGLRGLEVWNSSRREGSMRVTLLRPQEAQMLAALADQAVVKLSLGPTCTHTHMQSRCNLKLTGTVSSQS